MSYKCSSDYGYKTGDWPLVVVYISISFVVVSGQVVFGNKSGGSGL